MNFLLKKFKNRLTPFVIYVILNIHLTIILNYLQKELNMSGINLVEIAAEIVAAYVSNNTVAPQDLPSLIQQVHSRLQNITEASGYAGFSGDEVYRPAVPVKQSIFEDYLICLEDGQKFKSLKRHLKSHYNMTPEQYRSKWGLPADYPMVAPNYAEHRSNLAKQIGLGTARSGKTKKQMQKSA